MARIRSVHPGLFTDEAFVSLSSDAQMFFIGLWTEADDQGVFEWKPITLRMRLRPSKDGDVEPLLAELTAQNSIMRYEIGGRSYGAIRNFRKFQRPKKPNAVHPITPQVGTYVSLSAVSSELDDDEVPSVPPKSELAPQMEGGGGRRKGGGEKQDQPSLRSGVSAKGADEPQKLLRLSEPELPKCLERKPENTAIEAYNAVAARMDWPLAQRVTATREKHLRARLRECGGLEGWSAAMERAGRSPFLRGETGRGEGHEKWAPDLDFFLQEKTFTRLMEGKYDNRNGKADTGFLGTVAAAEDTLAARRARRANGSGQARPSGALAAPETPAGVSLAEGGEGRTEREAGHLPD